MHSIRRLFVDKAYGKYKTDRHLSTFRRRAFAERSLPRERTLTRMKEVHFLRAARAGGLKIMLACVP